MQWKMRKCPSCHTYTLKAECPKCNAETKTAHPAKYSKEDKYAEYRRRELYG